MLDWLKKKLGGGDSNGDNRNSNSNGNNGDSGGGGDRGGGSYTARPIPDDDADPTGVGRWVLLTRPDQSERFLGYVYVDAQAGMSLRGGPESTLDPATRPTHTIRLPFPGVLQPLSAAEVAARRLPEPPDWIQHYGPQPRPRAPWRADPVLRPLLHASFPDDVQVLTHDGEPRRTKRDLEECWVRISGAVTGPARTAMYTPESGLSEAEFARRYQARDVVYLGKLLNAPHHLESVRQGDTIAFLCGGGVPNPLMVTEQYLAERSAWTIAPCGKCGLSECLDPPSVMARTRFANMPPGAVMKSFTAFCARCGGIQMLTHKS